ncbi:MAG: C25 family cysteine peptidase [Bacteroidia bacterium]
MKKRLLTFALVIICLASFQAQTSIRLINQNSENSTLIEFKSASYSLNEVKTAERSANMVLIDKGASLLEKGNPDLQKLTASVLIPNEAEMQVNVVSSDFYDVQNVTVAPSKGNLMRNINPDDVPYTYGKAYSENVFFPASIATLSDPYILRDYRGQVVTVCPFQYNPVTKVLRVYTNVKVNVSVKNETGGQNSLINGTRNISAIDNEFETIYKSQFINYTTSNTRLRGVVSEEGSMLIICYDDFAATMAPFVKWKNQKGIATELVLKSKIGTSATATQIKKYITDYYAAHPTLKYVLLVGDAPQVACSKKADASGSKQDSDVDYGYMTGNDSYPELFVGRFSGSTKDQIAIMVNRTLKYETAPQKDGAWYKKSIQIGSGLGAGQGDNGEADWVHQRIIAKKLLAYTYNTIGECYDGSRGETDAAGDPTSSTVAKLVNAGASIITYTGHGSENMFVTSGFSSTSVNSLTNKNMWPFIWSVACVNGNFVNQTCFAEAWLRAGTVDVPTGAIATLMSTINQSWQPPMKGQDAMIDILVESDKSNIKRTFGGLSYNGCMQMNDTYKKDGYDMTDTWTTFGDPSVMVYTNTPTDMVVTHPASVALASTTITVACDVKGALVSLSKDGVILGTGISDGTSAIITITGATLGVIDVTATAFNKVPYFGKINVGTTGIAGNTAVNSFTVYPTLATNQLTISYKAEKLEKIKIALYNNLGQAVVTIVNEDISTGVFNKTIDISALQSGVYFCKLETQNTVVTKRIIIKK